MRAKSPAARRQLRVFISSMLALAMLLASSGRAAAETVPLPAGAATGNSSSTELVGTSCPAAGSCVAVGSYRDSNSATQGLIETETNGVWAATEAPTTGLGASYVGLSAVSCPSVGNCVAIGTYDNTSNTQQALLETETDGAWTGSELPLSALGATGHEMDFNAVSCSGVGSCAAVGEFSDAGNHEQAFVATDAGATWSVEEVDAAGLGGGTPLSVQLNDVACATASSCAAVGNYEDSSARNQGLIETDSGGTWTASKANLASLPSVATNPNVQLTSISCPASGSCTAVGRYVDASAPDGSYQGLVLSSTNGVWSSAGEFTLPANADYTDPSHIAQPGLGVDSVSCGSPGNCMAVGSYSATASNVQEGLGLSETGGSWSTGVEETPPTAAYTPSPNQQLNSVVCLAQGPCTALGIYTDSNGFTDAWVLSQRGSDVSTASVEVSAPETDGSASLACSTTDYCTATGYSSLSGTSYPFLLDAPAAPTSPSAQVGGTSAQVAWTTPADTGGLPITGYNTTANDLTDAGRGGQMQAVGTTGGPTFTGLTPGDSYTFTITPTSVLGNGIPVTTASVWVPWTKAQLLASLSGLLAPTGAASHLKKLRKSHGYTFSWTPLEAGRASVRWYVTTGRRKHRRKRLIGSGSATATSAAVIKVHVSLTGLGRRLVKADHRLRVQAKVTFVSGTTSVTRTHTFTLH